MGIFNRLKDIMKANANDLLNKNKDPEKVVDEYIRNITIQLAEVKKETSNIMKEEARQKDLVEENKNQVDKYKKLAEKAVIAGNDDDARSFIEKKQQYEKNGESLQKSYSAIKENADKMRKLHDNLTKNVQEIENRKKNIESKMSLAKAQEIINEANSSMQEYSDSMQAFEKLEQDTDLRLDTATSISEVNEMLYGNQKNNANEDEEKINEELEEIKKKLEGKG